MDSNPLTYRLILDTSVHINPVNSLPGRCTSLIYRSIKLGIAENMKREKKKSFFCSTNVYPISLYFLVFKVADIWFRDEQPTHPPILVGFQ